jgi:hypothetical protein
MLLVVQLVIDDVQLKYILLSMCYATVLHSLLQDVFGRDRHVNHRDDMSGVGSINSPSRTLYVGKLTKAGYKR